MEGISTSLFCLVSVSALKWMYFCRMEIMMYVHFYWVEWLNMYLYM